MEEHDAPMDEFQWEEFMTVVDTQTDRLCRLLDRHLAEPNFTEIIRREMGWELIQEEGERDLDAERAAFLFETDLEDDLEDGDEWKLIADFDNDYRTKECVPSEELYMLGYSISGIIQHWFSTLKEPLRSMPEIHGAVVHAMLIPTMVGAATGRAMDRKNEIGMRIALYKRGLTAANNTHQNLTAAKTKGNLPDIPITAYREALEMFLKDLEERIEDLRKQFNAWKS